MLPHQQMHVLHQVNNLLNQEVAELPTKPYQSLQSMQLICSATSLHQEVDAFIKQIKH